VKRDLTIPLGERIAILPFTNMTQSPGAGEKFANLLLVEVLKTGKLSVVDPGRVEDLLSRERIRLLDKLPPEQVKKLREKLQVNYVIVGTILEYKVVTGGKFDIPYLSVTLRMIDTESGEIVLATSRSASGREWEKVFGLGRIYSIEKLAKRLAGELARVIVSRVGK